MTDIIAAHTAEELHALCHAIDLAGAEQLEDLADSFAMSNNRDTARELRALAAWKTTHAPGGGAASTEWFVVDPGDPDALHYMMRPWHIVGIAMANEARLLTCLNEFAARDPGLRAAADTLVQRQRERIAHLEARLAELPPPEEGWDDDPDPPFFDQ